MSATAAHRASGKAAGRVRQVIPSHLQAAGVIVLTEAEAWDLYDSKARELLGMSADEFEQAWRRGDFRSRQEERAVRRVIMLRTKKPSRQ